MLIVGVPGQVEPREVPEAAHVDRVPVQIITASTLATVEYPTPVVNVKLNPPPPPPPPRAQPVSSVSGKLTGSVLAEAGKYVGVPYVWGGSSPSGFDCSGFVQYVYAKVGVNLPRTTGQMRDRMRVTSNPQPGDVVWSPGHVGLYVSPGVMIDAPTRGGSVQVRKMWQKNPVYLTP